MFRIFIHVLLEQTWQHTLLNQGAAQKMPGFCQFPTIHGALKVLSAAWMKVLQGVSLFTRVNCNLQWITIVKHEINHLFWGSPICGNPHIVHLVDSYWFMTYGWAPRLWVWSRPNVLSAIAGAGNDWSRKYGLIGINGNNGLSMWI